MVNFGALEKKAHQKNLGEVARKLELKHYICDNF